MFDKFMKKKRLDDYASSFCWRKKILVMHLLYFLMIGLVVLVPASVNAQDKTISLEIRSETLSSVLMKIKDQTGVNILYNENVLRDISCKDMKLEKVTVEEALNRIFEGTHFTYEVSRGVIVIRERQVKELLPVPQQVLTGNFPFQSRLGNMYYSFQWLEWNLKKSLLIVTRRFQKLL